MNEELKQLIINNLREVYDPEIPLNIYDLGLIYDISGDTNHVYITMTLTSAFCPAADYIVMDVKGAITTAGVDEVDVDIVFDPQWGPDNISEDGKLILGIY